MIRQRSRRAAGASEALARALRNAFTGSRGYAFERRPAGRRIPGSASRREGAAACMFAVRTCMLDSVPSSRCIAVSSEPARALPISPTAQPIKRSTAAPTPRCRTAARLPAMSGLPARAAEPASADSTGYRRCCVMCMVKETFPVSKRGVRQLSFHARH